MRSPTPTCHSSEHCPESSATTTPAGARPGAGTATAPTRRRPPPGPPPRRSVFGLPRGRVSGIAPGARLIAYRVCLSLGCYSSDSVSAIEQAVLDGVDVINFSISGGADPYSDPVELAFLDAYAAGIEVNASAGNAGPGPGTADHGGPWVTTVGASYGPRAYMTTLATPWLRWRDDAAPWVDDHQRRRGEDRGVGRRRRGIRGPDVQQPDGTRDRHGPRGGLRARKRATAREILERQTWRRRRE